MEDVIIALRCDVVLYGTRVGLIKGGHNLYYGSDRRKRLFRG